MDVLSHGRRLADAGRGWARGLLRDPRFRSLRRLLAVGLISHLALAPISSWGLDTPALALAAENVIAHGDPYYPTNLSEPLLDPPLGVLLAAPLLGVLALVAPGTSVLRPSPGHLPQAIATGEVSPALPDPAVLAVQKLPSIGADALVAILLFAGLEIRLGRRPALLAAGAWLLNPDVIWSTAVVGHFDAVAALLVAAGVVWLARGGSWGAGLLLGLGTSVKIYPILLVPLFVAFVVAQQLHTGSRRAVLPKLGRLFGGVALGLTPALAYLPQLWNLYVVRRILDQQPFTGISPWGFTQPGTLAQVGVTSTPLGPPSTAVLLLPVVLATVLGAVFVFLRFRKSNTDEDTIAYLALASLAVVGAALLSYRAPQPENVVALVPLAGLALPLLRPRSWTVSLAVTAFGGAIAFSALTPLAFFYPVAALVGPGATRFLDSIVLTYATWGVGWESRPGFLLIEGALGAAFLAATVALALTKAALAAKRARSGAGETGTSASVTTTGSLE